MGNEYSDFSTETQGGFSHEPSPPCTWLFIFKIQLAQNGVNIQRIIPTLTLPSPLTQSSENL